MIVSRLNRVSSITESSDAPYAVACPLLRRAELLALACVGGVQLPNHTLKALSHLPTLSEKHVIRRIDRVLRPTFCGISSSIPTSRRTDLQISCLSRRPAPAANAESNTGAHKLPLCRPSFHANPRAMHTLPGYNPCCEVDTLQDPVSTMRSPPPHIFHLEPGCTHTSLGLIYTCRATPCEIISNMGTRTLRLARRGVWLASTSTFPSNSGQTRNPPQQGRVELSHVKCGAGEPMGTATFITTYSA